jgi:hypothetical protein
LPPGSDAAISTTTLLDQARKRQAQVKSFEVQLNQSEDLAAGAISGRFAPPPGRKSKPVPAKRTTLTSVNRLVVAGNNFRYEDHHPYFSRDPETLHQRPLIAVANGRESKTFFPKGPMGDSAGVGLLGEHGWNEWAKNSVLAPLMLTFRGLEPTLARYDLRLLKPGNDTLPIHGATCSRFDLASSSGVLNTLWIDDSGLIRRMQFSKSGKLLTQCDVRYEQRYGVDTFPVSWVEVWYSRTGSVLSEDHVEVLDAKVNATVPRTEFDVRFPPGTTVHDNKNQSKPYLVQDDGSMREKDGPSGEVRSQEAPGFLSRYWRQLVAVLAVLAILFLAGYLIRRRERRASPDGTQRQAETGNDGRAFTP